MTPVLASETLSLISAHAATTTFIILSSIPGDREMMPESSACIIPHNVWTPSSFPLSEDFSSPCLAPPLAFLFLPLELHTVVHDGCISEEPFLGDAQQRRENMFTNIDDCRKPCSTSTISNPSTRMLVRRRGIDSCHSRWHAKASNYSGIRSTALWSVVKSIKHVCRGPPSPSPIPAAVIPRTSRRLASAGRQIHTAPAAGFRPICSSPRGAPRRLCGVLCPLEPRGRYNAVDTACRSILPLVRHLDRSVLSLLRHAPTLHTAMITL